MHFEPVASEPTAEETRAELSRILASAEFAASENLTHFLKYVVDESLAGRASLLKERNIARKALNRDAKFDPRLDSIVRVVAQKLRQALERYYAKDGAANPLRIEVPKGSYQPVFRVPSGRASTAEQGSERDGVPPESGGRSVSQVAEFPVRKILARWPLANYGIIIGVFGAIIFLSRWSSDGGSEGPVPGQRDTPAISEFVERTGSLPYRVRDGVTEVLLVRTLRDSHWTIPKAMQDPESTVSHVASQEAFKEAGVRGAVRLPAIGDYIYQRRNRWYRVTVYPVEIGEEFSSWPEMSRRRKWCDTETASDLVASSELAALVRSFDPVER